MGSLRKAVDLKCKDCSYDPLEPGRWRQQVEACTVTDCALWPLRPRSAAKRPEKAPSTGVDRENDPEVMS